MAARTTKFEMENTIYNNPLPQPIARSRQLMDRRWSDLLAAWHDNRFGDTVAEKFGDYNGKVHYALETLKTTDGSSLNILDGRNHADAAIKAAKARGQAQGPMFSAIEPYTARRGEASTTEDDISRALVEGVGHMFAGVFDKLGLESLANGTRKITNNDRSENRRVLKRNLLSRWRDQGAAGNLLVGSALKSSPIGQVDLNVPRGPDAAANFTTAGFQNPAHNFNVDGWDRDYKLRFYEAMGVDTEQGSGMANRPSRINVQNAAMYSSNLGQIAPFDDDGTILWRSGGHYRSAGGWNETTDTGSGISDWINKIFAPAPTQTRLEKLQSELLIMQRTFMKKLGPGPRIPVPFRVAVNLDDLLQQNIIIPPGLHRQNPDSKFDPMPVNSYGDAMNDIARNKEWDYDDLVKDDALDVYRQLYIENANPINVGGMYTNQGSGTVVASNKRRNPGGVIAGIPVADLQEPFLDQRIGPYTPNDKKAVWSLEDDIKRNNLDNMQRGFNSNYVGGPETKGLQPAVWNDMVDKVGEGDSEHSYGLDNNSYFKSQGIADAQSFPFLFETINKRGSKRSLQLSPIFRKSADGAILLDEEKNPIVDGYEKNPGIEYKQFAAFQATLNSINESYSPTWTSKHFFGRTEQIHSYTMTDRSFDISFSITVDSMRKLQNLYERVLWLAQQTYASYDENGRMKAGPIIKMTIGDMFANMTGFIRSLSYDWNYLGGSSPKWEITQGLRIPMACNVSLSFAVMHDRMPDRNHNFYTGPITHPMGLVSERGLTTQPPWEEGYAPLISVLDNPSTKISNNPDISEVAMTNYRNEMFIWNQANEAMTWIQ